MSSPSEEAYQRPRQDRGHDVDEITVLLVDDHAAFTRLAAMRLEEIDEAISVLVGKDGEEALDRLGDADVDCVVSDYKMPGIDGLELCRRVRERHPDLPFLLLTGYSDEETERRALQAGADGCLVKAADADAFTDLARRVRSHVQGPRTGSIYREAWQSAPVGLSIHDPGTGELLDANDRFCAMLGSSRDELVGSSADMASLGGPPLTVERICTLILDASGQEPESFECSQETPTGDRLWLKVVVERVWIDGEERAVVSIRDLTQRRVREETIRSMYETIADRDLDFAEKVDRLMSLGRKVLGTGFATLSRLRGEEYIFEHVQSPGGEVQPGDVVSIHDTLCEQTVLREGTLVVDAPLEARNLTRGAALQLSCYVGAPVYIGDEVHGTFCFYDVEPRDTGFSDWEVTLVDLMSRWISVEMERNRVREALERENERLEQFASMVSHDLRSPLTVAAGHVELLDEEITHPSLGELREALQRTQEIVEDALTWARTGSSVGSTEPVSVPEIARQTWQLVDHGNADLVVETQRTIQADERRLRRLFENLFRNAVEHGGDDVTVTVGDLDQGFFVEDDGVGFSQEDLQELFQTGYTTASEGTGFGLAIVEQIVEAHGWVIRAKNGSDRGARFEIAGVELADSPAD